MAAERSLIECVPQREPVTRYWTRRAIVQAIQFWASQHKGSPPRRRDWDPPDAPDWPPCKVVQERFGTWNMAIQAAGFIPRPAPVPSEREQRLKVDLRLELGVHAKIANAAEQAGMKPAAFIARLLAEWADAR